MERAFMAALASLPQMNIMSLPRLVNLTGGPEGLWNTLKKGGKKAETLVGADRAALWKRRCGSLQPEAALEALGQRGIRVLLPGDKGFPERLRAIYDPPALLFARGLELAVDVPYVAIVGSRRASDYGKWAAQALGAELGRREVVVVSGAAYGVDGRAHLGCLRAGGFTIAVMGCGVDRAYPSFHAGLLEGIAGSGCVLSEFPPGSDPLPWHFPQRNRIIAGLSHAVVVVEAREKSGALITADMALEEGREVMAVPGPIDSPQSRGTNNLIQKGAKLVAGVEDIIEELPFEGRWNNACVPAAVEAGGPGALSEQERAILDLLEEGPRSLDWMAFRMGEKAGGLLAHLTSLVFKGLVLEEAGGRYRLLRQGGRLLHKQQ